MPSAFPRTPPQALNKKMDLPKPQIDDQESGVVTSALFNAADADVVFRSSDGTLFRLHARQLDLASDGFPPSEFSSAEEVVDLPEDAQLLELMFQFVYPRLLPSLESFEFSTLASLAIVVEKYQIFTGMKLCHSYMAHALSPDNAIAVLDYSVRYGYPSLANRAAPYVTLQGLSEGSATNAFSPELFRRWVPYYNNWTSTIRSTMTGRFALRDYHHTKPDIHGRVKGLSACSSWSGYQKKILTALANVAGIKNDSSIAQLITVPREAQDCCLNEAQCWQSELLRMISEIPPFFEV